MRRLRQNQPRLTYKFIRQVLEFTLYIESVGFIDEHFAVGAYKALQRV